MKKRIFSLFLVVCMLFGMLPGFTLPVSAYAINIRVNFTDKVEKVSVGIGDSFSSALADAHLDAEDVSAIEVHDGEITADDWDYIYANNSSFSELTSLTVAEAVYPVADIPDNFFDLNGNPGKLQSVSISNATAIGDFAFFMCNYLAEVSLPDATTINDEAFWTCSELVDVEIPKVTVIGEKAFFACENLTTLKVPEAPPTVANEAFLGLPDPRNLFFVDADGNELTDDDLDNARAAYKAVDDGDTEDNLWYGWNIIPQIELDIEDGSVDISSGSNSGNMITQGSRIYDNYLSDTMITITGTSSTNSIVVNGVAANVTLRDLNIDVSGTEDSCAFQLTGGANVQLMLSGINYLKSHTKRAGIEVPVGQSITIGGGDEDFLTATSRSAYSGGAGIGGSGLGLNLDCGTINISGGNITANGGSWSSGIGGGKSGLGGIINISGGSIIATGGNSGIGGGAYADGGIINITGGNVTAIGESSGIGGGYNNGSESNPACDAAVTIMEEATVVAAITVKNPVEDVEYFGEAISANGGVLEAASTARILTANFAEFQVSGTDIEVYRAVYGDRLTGITPSEAYFTAAFTVPAGTFNLKNSGRVQQYTNTGIPAAIDFVIPDTAGIYVFDQVEDAPVLTSVSISGTAQVGQTLTAAVAPSGATASYQWKSDNVNINGATGNTYVPVAADIGKTITITATATGEWFGTVTSDPTSVVIAASQASSTGGKSKAAIPTVIKRPEKNGLPYYIKDGKKIFIGFSATGKYIVPEGAIVEFGENPKSFNDIENHWARSSIEFVTEREIFLGLEENRFGPEVGMTRAMFVTVIGRLYERSYGNITGNTTFSDVDKEAYYAGYVAWAHENGIIEGIGENNFAPDALVSREQMAAILFRFANFLGKAPQVDGAAGITYTDKANISGWAMDSAEYCELTSIITGADGGKFEPKAAATRAEVATVIERFINEILKTES